MTPEEQARASQFHSSIENQAFLDQAKAVKAGYLPTEGIHIGAEVRIFNYKAIGRTGLAVVTDSPLLSAPPPGLLTNFTKPTLLSGPRGRRRSPNDELIFILIDSSSKNTRQSY